MGTAILQGFLHLKFSPAAAVNISHISVTVRQPSQANHLLDIVHSAEGAAKDLKMQIPIVSVQMQDKNASVILDSEIVILGCKPAAAAFLGEHNVRKAFLDQAKSKILVSITGGLTIAQMQNFLYGVGGAERIPRRLAIVRVVPNIAACIRESITVISSPSSSSADDTRDVNRVSNMFSLLGPTIQVPESQLNIASALASSSIAFYANLISAAAAAGLHETGGDSEDVALSQKDCLWISAHAARGASSLIISGGNPNDLTSQVATKNGSTEVGLQVMERAKVADAMNSAIVECAKATATLSQVEHKW